MVASLHTPSSSTDQPDIHRRTIWNTSPLNHEYKLLLRFGPLHFVFQVTFLMMPLEIGWNITVTWQADDTTCRIMAFFRTFGLFLSSFVIVSISLDRLAQPIIHSVVSWTIVTYPPALATPIIHPAVSVVLIIHPPYYSRIFIHQSL